MHTYVCERECLVERECVCVYVNICVWVLVGGLNICMYANAYSVCITDSLGKMAALRQPEVEAKDQ